MHIKNNPLLLTTLLVLLIGSNAWWMLTRVDNASLLHDKAIHIENHKNTLQQIQQLIPLIKPLLYKELLVKKAEKLYYSTSYEKDGCVWVGVLGLKFDENDHLIHISPSWNGLQKDPCFP